MVPRPSVRAPAGLRDRLHPRSTATTYHVAMDVAGAGIVVTGAAGGIGRALARKFHSLGARVVVSDVQGPRVEAVAAELRAARPDSALAVVVDVSSESGNRELVERADEWLRVGGRGIDLFFANAGVGGGTFLESTDESQWQLAFDVSVNAHRWAAKHLVPLWLERGAGYFCSTASAAGLLTQIGSAPYSVTKHAAVGFAEWLSITYGARGIKVSCLCPQGVNTDMINQSDGFSGPTDVVRSAADVLEPEVVADVVAEAVAAEQFLILPHPEVAGYEQFRATNRDKWLAGMRRLQAKVLGF
jgi:NAD(P)-dependent dehydrogenase (short-subunit alcohol dehydrogenase family)